MVKGEVNYRQKATTEQVRLAQVTQDAPHTVSDSTLTNQIKKVMELTRCSQTEAEFALFDHDNNVEGAVLAMFDRPDNGNLWKETKGRKSKKLETNEKDDYYGNRRGDPSKANRGRNSSYQPRGGANPRGPRDPQGQDQRRDRPQQGSRGNTSSRGGHRPNNGNGSNQKDKNQDEQQKFPAVDSFTADLGSKDDENTWKNGPLVFEQSVAIAPLTQPPGASTPASTLSRSEKLSFAAVAASKKVLPPPPPPAPPVVPSISATSHVSSSKSAESQQKPEQIEEVTSPNVREYSSSVTEQNEPSTVSLVSTSVASTSFGPAVASNTVNKEFTDKLKNDIGIGLHSTPPAAINSLEATAVLQARSPVSSSVLDTPRNSIPTTHSSSLLHDVEFISGDGPSMLDFQFGFHPDAPPPPAVVDNILSDRQQQQNQQQQLSKGREAAANNALSYMNTCSLEYQSNDLRGNNSGAGLGQKTSSQQQPLNPIAALQQQQPSAQQQQQQHNSLQQQQQQMYAAAAAQFPGYGIPYLYSPVASNMRDVEQLNSFTAMTPFAYGLNQLDMQMNAMMPPSATPSALGSQNHHQSQQTASSQHRGAPPVENNKFQQGNVSSTNGLQSNNSYSQLGSQSGHQMRNQGGMDNGAAAAGPNAVAPPPGFSGPPFLTQPSFQSLFQLPSYTHPQLTMPYFLQGNTQQQRQPQSQHASQPASLQQQPQHHQRPTEHASYLDMNKYPQQQASITTTTNSNNMLPQSGNSYQSLGSGPLQSGHQQRNQQGVAGAGGLDNGLQYYQSPKWSGGNGGWRA